VRAAVQAPGGQQHPGPGSLDGVIEDADRWIGPWFNPELGQAVGSMIAVQDAMLLGRVTYGTFAAHWPHQAGEMADTMNGTAKYVVSGTLTSAGWQNSTLIPAASAFAEIAELKTMAQTPAFQALTAEPWREVPRDAGVAGGRRGGR
jgi:dihydrofolate reductase